ncbi:MAG: transpeptidase family protein [Deltaproteobacteria bacterium]|nr:transpeptidase family protein [Deltaproteobacteria bacterium]
MTVWARYRIIIVGMVFVAFFAAVITRACYLQILEQKRLQDKAQNQHHRAITLIPQRGTIYDSRGEELALSVDVDSVYVNPRQVMDHSVAKVLASYLSLPIKEVRSKIESGRNFVWLKRQISPRESEKVRALKISGVGFVAENRRYYPNSSVGAQVVGFTGVDPRGLEGLELFYDKEIMGKAGQVVYGVDARGRGMGMGRFVVQGGHKGNNLWLTLDKNLQYILEKELALGVKDARAKAGSAVMVEVASGKILAMANYPTFNPNAFRQFDSSRYRNRVVCDSFEPGSTFKPFVLAAAFEEKLISTGEWIDCERGRYMVSGKIIHDTHPRNKIQVDDILKFSSNIASAKIGRSLGRQRLYHYLGDFGFGRKTGIDLPGEVGGVLRSPSSWYELDLANISFGQGVSVTPLQIAMATAALGNGGLLMRPYIVEKIVDTEGNVLTQHSPEVVRRVVSEDVANLVRTLLQKTSEEGGTATRAAVPGYVVAGKTGTAQKADKTNRGYSAEDRVGSFVGMVPGDAPRIVILVMIDEPGTSPYGSVVAAPVFSRIAAQSLPYLRIPPTTTVVADSPSKKSKEANADSSDSARSATGGGEIISGYIMPDLRGMSARQVLCWMERNKLDLNIRGHGRVVDQSPRGGEPIRYQKPCWVRLAEDD